MEGASGGSIFCNNIIVCIIHVARYYWFEQKAF